MTDLLPIEAEVYDDLEEVFKGRATPADLDDWFGSRAAWQPAAALLIRRRLILFRHGELSIREVDAGGSVWRGPTPPLNAADDKPPRPARRKTTPRRARAKPLGPRIGVSPQPVRLAPIPSCRRPELPGGTVARDMVIHFALERGLTYIQAGIWLGISSVEVAESNARFNERRIAELEARL